MSHNLYTVNATAPNAQSQVLLNSTAVTFGASMYPTSRSVGFSSIAVGAGKNFPYGRSLYNQTTFGTGASFSLSSTATTGVIASQFSADWFDVITLPAGSWFLIATIAQDTTQTSTGRFVWVNQATGVRLGPVCSTRDSKRSAYAVGYITSASSFSVAVRCVTASMYKANNAGVGRTAISFHKWQ